MGVFSLALLLTSFFVSTIFQTINLFNNSVTSFTPTEEPPNNLVRVEKVFH